MRESTYTYPLQNRACVSITPALYDRRALDVRSSLPLLNNLTGLTYLTSTSPRIREVMTQDGGLERLLDIMRESCLEPISPPAVDLWGLNGPASSRVLPIDRQNSLKHSLAFQSVVNIGVRGSETVRTRVVQSGALDLVAHILESWMDKRGIWVHPHTLGSAAAVRAYHKGGPVPIRPRGPRIQNPPPQPTPTIRQRHEGEAASTAAANAAAEAVGTRRPDSPAIPARPIPPPPVAPQRVEPPPVEAASVDADVDMADSEVEDPAIQSAGEDASMEIDPVAEPQTLIASVTAATPRASGSRLPNSVTGALDIPMRQPTRGEESRDSSGANSLTGSEDARLVSDNEQTEPGPARHRPSALNLNVPGLANGGNSNQSSPMGTPTRTDTGELMRQLVRRETITARPAGLAPPTRTRLAREADDGDVSDNGDTTMEQETVNAGIAAAVRAGDTAEFEEQREPPEVEIVEVNQGIAPEEPDPEVLAAEQARLDMEAGAPPGQPGAATTPPATAPTVIDVQPPTPAQQLAGPLVIVAPTVAAPPRAGAPVAVHPPGQAQVIIANGAPRGFHELSAYVGISAIIHPKGDRFSDDSVLLSLQLLAYLSKYPHVRTCFHHPSLPMHRTFEYDENVTLNERPHMSATRNMFSLVERFTFRPSAADPTLFRVPNEIQYWAGVIMRNACRKDDLQNGIRQCASMNCGKWETFAREFAKCRRCRKAKYCSKACQSAAWSEGHRFWCNPRPDADAPPDPNATVVEPLPGQSDIPPVGATGPGRLGMDFWELALRLSMQNPPYAALARMLADTPVPVGFDFGTILRWIHDQLAPLLWGRTDDQDMFLDVVRQQPNVIQSLYIQSQGDPRALAQGVEMTMMQARLQQQQRQVMRRARPVPTAPGTGQDPLAGAFPTPTGTRDGRQEAAAALRQQIEAARPRQPRQRTTAADTERTIRAPVPQPDLLGRNGPNPHWITEIPAFRPPPPPANPPSPASRGPLFGQPTQAPAEAPRTGGRTFSLTEVWRNMAQRTTNTNNTNNTNNTANGTNNNNPDTNNQGRR